MGRGQEHRTNVINILNFIKENKMNVKTKINTLVSKINQNEIIDIGKFLEKYNIERWKLFKFIPLRNLAIYNGSNFEINDTDFNYIVSNIKKIYGNKMNICACNEETIQSNYLLINPVGDFIITENFKDKKIYNIEEENIAKLKKYL